jgi:hypothetical protein
VFAGDEAEKGGELEVAEVVDFVEKLFIRHCLKIC